MGVWIEQLMNCYNNVEFKEEEEEAESKCKICKVFFFGVVRLN